MNTTPAPEQKPKVSRTTISLPEALLEQGKQAAAADCRDFSNYVAVLIRADLEKSASEASL